MVPVVRACGVGRVLEDAQIVAVVAALDMGGADPSAEFVVFRVDAWTIRVRRRSETPEDKE